MYLIEKLVYEPEKFPPNKWVKVSSCCSKKEIEIDFTLGLSRLNGIDGLRICKKDGRGPFVPILTTIDKDHEIAIGTAVKITHEDFEYFAIVIENGFSSGGKFVYVAKTSYKIHCMLEDSYVVELDDEYTLYKVESEHLPKIDITNKIIGRFSPFNIEEEKEIYFYFSRRM